LLLPTEISLIKTDALRTHSRRKPEKDFYKMNDKRYDDNVSQAAGKAKEDLTTWVGDSASQLGEGFEKWTGDAREALVDAAETVKKDVRHGLSQYNAKAQEIADRVPGGFGEKAARYPWVVVTLSLAVGLLLGNVLKPARKPSG